MTRHGPARIFAPEASLRNEAAHPPLRMRVGRDEPARRFSACRRAMWKQAFQKRNLWRRALAIALPAALAGILLIAFLGDNLGDPVALGAVIAIPVMSLAIALLAGAANDVDNAMDRLGRLRN